MSKEPVKRPSRALLKRHHTERFRAPQLWTERWTNAKAALVGVYLGQHKTSVQISALLRDGTSDATIRAIVKKWRIPTDQIRRGTLVELKPYARKLLEKQSEKLGITPEVFLERICDCVIRDRLYEAVTDGRFDEKPTAAS